VLGICEVSNFVYDPPKAAVAASSLVFESQEQVEERLRLHLGWLLSRTLQRDSLFVMNGQTVS
jgi:hypothetical protein